jgi:selenocysteine lyase/cysteine desulfurase
MQMPQAQIESTLRISLGMPTTNDEIARLLDALARLMPRAVVQ